MRPLLCLVAAVLMIARSAHADDREAVRDEARKAFAEGQEADKAEDWETAIEHYLHANELVPHHFALYNIARDYERLGQLREAATWYQRYVEAAPPSPDRDRVGRLIGELKLRPSKLTVTSMPAGARVTIDGKRAGVTPFTAPVKGGDHRVGVELGGQRDERDVTLEFGEPDTVELTLQVGGTGGSTGAVGSEGILVVRGQPQNALVTIDEVPAGTLPMSVPIAAGVHRIKVTSYGFSDYETTATVVRGGEMPVNVSLTRAPGSVDPAHAFQVGYMIGFGGGADLRGNGALVLADFGVRFGPGDICVRIGKALGLTAIDLVGRWALTKTRLAPYLGIGWSYTSEMSADRQHLDHGLGVRGPGRAALRPDPRAGHHVLGDRGDRGPGATRRPPAPG